MSYGYRYSKEGEVIGEIDTLRYSALNTWLSSKESYRKRYYGGASVSTPEMIYGHKIHQAIERGEVVLDGLPRYEKSEYNIELVLKSGVKIGGCIDSFHPETFSLLDYKTSHRNKLGKAPWNQVKVTRQMQLVFYSLLVREKHDKVDPWTKLIWIETVFGNKSVEFDGHTLEAETRELKLTGHYEVFKRRIAKWERDGLTKIIEKASVEIELDFSTYKNATTIRSL